MGGKPGVARGAAPAAVVRTPNGVATPAMAAMCRRPRRLRSLAVWEELAMEDAPSAGFGICTNHNAAALNDISSWPGPRLGCIGQAHPSVMPNRASLREISIKIERDRCRRRIP